MLKKTIWGGSLDESSAVNNIYISKERLNIFFLQILDLKEENSYDQNNIVVMIAGKPISNA